MYKLIVMYHQPEDEKKWDEHYYNVHIPLAAKVPNTRILTTNKNGLDEAEGKNPYYLIAEMTWDSKEAMDAAFQTPEGIECHNDFMSFAEGKVTMVGLDVQEYEIGTGNKKVNILITGGSKGIGKATALRFSKPGNTIFINYAHDDTAAESTVNEIHAKGATAHLVKADVGQKEDIQQMIQVVKAEVDNLDLIVHCAVATISGGVFDVSYEDWLKAIQVGSLSLIEVVRESLPILKKGSTIIALSSRGATNAIPEYAALGTPKALLESIMKYMVLELAPKGIRTNVVAAGPLDTEAFRSVFKNAEERLELAAQNNPSGRNINFDDVTNMIEFLASPQAEMIQGRVMFVDGGLYVK